MKGLNINGYTIVELAGSGQHGLLYLARDARGREAVVRVVRDTEDNLSIHIFTEEARKLVPSATDVATATASSGDRVLLASEPVPDSGSTRHAATQRIPRADGGPLESRPARRNWLLVALLLIASVGVGGGLYVLIARPMRATPPVVVVSVASAPSAEPPTEPEVDPPPVLPVAKPAKQLAARPVCVIDDRWREAIRGDLGKLRAMADATPSGSTAFEVTEARLLKLAAAATSSEDCLRVDQELSRARAEVLAVGTQPRAATTPRCMPDEKWRKRVDLDLNDIERLGTRLEALEVEQETLRIHELMTTAKTAADCSRVEREIKKLIGRAIPKDE